MKYKAFDERTPDTQYKELLRRILREGKKVETQLDEDAYMVLGHQMRFDMSNGFPAVTERDIINPLEKKNTIFYQSIGECCGFLNGVRKNEELKSFGCKWWGPWVTKGKCEKRGLEEGDIGDGSYGAAWHDFPTSEGRPFNQIDFLIRQIKEKPHLRTHLVTSWIPQYVYRVKGWQQKVTVAPCHGIFHIMINKNSNEISMHHFQRSADTPVGLPADMCMYGALLMMIGQATGYDPKELVYTISDAHIYTRQIADVEEIVAMSNGKFPTVNLDTDNTDIFKFRADDFSVKDYHPASGRRKIDTPV